MDCAKQRQERSAAIRRWSGRASYPVGDFRSVMTTWATCKESVEQIPGGYTVKDAHGQSLAYAYGRETKAAANTARVLTYRQQHREAANLPSG